MVISQRTLGVGFALNRSRNLGERLQGYPPRATARVGILEEPRWERPGSRRGGGGEERGGDACIAQPGKRAPTRGDANIPTPTRPDASEDAAHGDSYKTYPCKPLPTGFLQNAYPCN